MAKGVSPSPGFGDVVNADGPTFVLRERITEIIQNRNGAHPVPAPVSESVLVARHRFAKVVKQRRHRNGVSGKSACIGKHVLIDFNGMLGKSAALPVVAVTAAREVAGRLKIGNDGLRARAADSAKNGEDTLFDFCHTDLMLAIYTFESMFFFNSPIKPFREGTYEGETPPYRRPGE